MRTVLTFAALILIAVLTAALVAPPIIDWRAQRGWIEAELSRRVGAQVRIGGAIEARLFPTPYIEVGQLQVGGPDRFVAEAARVEFALGSLASGRLRLAEVDLLKPRLELDLRSPPPEVGLGFDRLKVRDGRVRLTGSAGAPIELGPLDFDASATPPGGPIRALGSGALSQGRRFGFELVAERAGSVKLSLEDSDSGARFSFDGGLKFGDDGPTIAGAAAASGEIAFNGRSPWKAGGALSADLNGARLENLAASFGPPTRALNASGRLSATFGDAPEIVADLQTKQLNLDGFLRREGEDSAPPTRALEAFAELGRLVVDGGAPKLSARLTLAAPTAYLGAQTLDDVKFKLMSAPGEPLKTAFESGLPGSGRLKLDGGFEFGAAPQFSGRLQARVADVATLGQWAARGEPALVAKAKALGEALPYAQMSAGGELVASKAGFSLRDLDLNLDRTRYKGAVVFTAPQAPTRGRLYADLSTDSLDLNAAPDFADAGFWLGDLDLSLNLDAARLRIAHAGESAVESGSLHLKAQREGEVLSLERLSVANLGGASVEAEGALTPARRSLQVKLDAARLGDFAALIARVAPNAYTRGFAERAAALSPAKAVLSARGEGVGGTFPFDFVAAEGEAGGAHFTARLSNAPAPVNALSFEASVEAGEAAALMKPLGLRPPPSPVGKGRLNLSAVGEPNAGFEGTASAEFAGLTLNGHGRFKPDASADEPTLYGGLTVKGDNALPALAALRWAGAATPPAAVDLSADFTWRGDQIAAPRIVGALAGSKVNAQLTWSPLSLTDPSSLAADVALAQTLAGEAPTPAGGWRGDIGLDRASAAALLSLPLGSLTAPKAPARWSEAKFAEPLLIPPRAELKLNIGALEGGGAEARNVSARLKLDRGKYEIDEAGADVGAAHVGGRATLRRDGPLAALTGALDVDHLTLDRPALAGGLGVSVDFAGSGASPSALIASLVGEGQAQLSGLRLPHLDPGGLDRVFLAAQAPGATIDEPALQRGLAQELDKAPLPLADGVLPLALASGALRAGPLDIGAAETHGRLTLGFDLKTFELSALAQLVAERNVAFWSGPPPSVGVVVSGPLDAPERRLDASSLAAGLAAEQIAREADRIATLEADMRERAWFNRRMKAEAFLEASRREEAAYEAEQARLKNEAERRRVEDRLMEAAQAKAKAAAAAEAPPSPEAPAAADPTANGLY